MQGGKKMLTGFHAAVSGLYYNEQRLGVISNNMANANTSAFRSSQMMFRTRKENDFTQWMDRDAKERSPDFYGIENKGVYRSYEKPGKAVHTGNKLDVAIDGAITNGFFRVQSTDPADRNTYYTRNGTLAIGHMDGKANSPTVLFAGGHVVLDASNQPINIDPSLGELTITGNGTIYQGEAEVGKLPVFRFNKSSDAMTQEKSNLQLLEAVGETLYRVPDQFKSEFNPTVIDVGAAGTDHVLTQGSREGSNVDIFKEVAEMMITQETYSANTKVIKEQADGLSKLFQTVRG
jgi:flagellar basal body rod protein FlgG